MRFSNFKTTLGILCLVGFAPPQFAAEGNPKFRHALTLVHPHRASNLIVSKSPAEPTPMQTTEIQLAQTKDFGLFRLVYSYQYLWRGLSPWVGIGGNLHKGFIDYDKVGSAQKIEVTAQLGFGVVVGANYRIDLHRLFYLSPVVGYGHYFSSQINANFPTLAATQPSGCNETCVTGSVHSLVYGLLLGWQFLPYLAFELGLEHNLFWSGRRQTLTDGATTIQLDQATAFSDGLMSSFAFTFQFGALSQP